MQTSLDQFSIRWRWLWTGVAAVILCSSVVWGIHVWQIDRMSARTLAEARSAAAADDHQLACDRYAVCLQLVPDHTAALEEYASLVLQSDADITTRDATAFNLLDRALQSGSASREARVQFFRTAAKLGRHADALRVLSTLPADDCHDPELLSLAGRCYLSKGSYHEAAAAFDQALQLQPDFADAWAGRVQLTEATEGHAAALRMAEHMAQQVPGAKALVVKARRLQQATRLEEAATAYWEAAELDSQNLETAQEFADFILYNVPPGEDMNLKMVESSYDILTGVAKNIDYMTAARIADLAHRLGRHDAAVQHYQRCLEFRPLDPFALGRMAELQLEQRRFEEAYAAVDRLSQTRAMALLSNTLKGRILLAEGRTEDAKMVLENAIQESGDPGLQQGAYYFLIQALWQLDQNHEAVVVARELLSVASSSDDARELYVQTLTRTRQFDEAMLQLTDFRDSGRYLFPLLMELIQTAKADGRPVQLERSVQNIATLRTSSAVPAVFRACQAFDQAHYSAAETTLLGLAAESPANNVYWETRQAILRQLRNRFSQAPPRSVAELTDNVARFVWCLETVRSNSTFSDSHPAIRYVQQEGYSADSLTVTARVVRQLVLEDRTSTAAELLQRLMPKNGPTAWATTANAAAVRAFATALADAGDVSAAADLLTAAVANGDAGIVFDLCQLASSMGDGKVAGLWQRMLSQLPATTDSAIRQILEAEHQATHRSPETAQQQLRSLSANSDVAFAALLSLLRLDGAVEKVNTSVRPEIDQMLQAAPNNPDVLHACGLSLKASARLRESVQCHVRAFAIRHDPRDLLYAAHARWLSGSAEEAAATLQLAESIGLNLRHLTAREQQLLNTLKSAPELKHLLPQQPSDTLAISQHQQPR